MLVGNLVQVFPGIRVQNTFSEPDRRPALKPSMAKDPKFSNVG